jgi:hypothetical protein
VVLQQLQQASRACRLKPLGKAATLQVKQRNMGLEGELIEIGR